MLNMLNKEAMIEKAKVKTRIYRFDDKEFVVYGKTQKELDDLLELYLAEYEISQSKSDKYEYILNRFKLNRDVTVVLTDDMVYNIK